jgi:hypothetical protein
VVLDLGQDQLNLHRKMRNILEIRTLLGMIARRIAPGIEG